MSRSSLQRPYINRDVSAWLESLFPDPQTSDSHVVTALVLIGAAHAGYDLNSLNTLREDLIHKEIPDPIKSALFHTQTAASIAPKITDALLAQILSLKTCVDATLSQIGQEQHQQERKVVAPMLQPTESEEDSAVSECCEYEDDDRSLDVVASVLQPQETDIEDDDSALGVVIHDSAYTDELDDESTEDAFFSAGFRV